MKGANVKILTVWDFIVLVLKIKGTVVIHVSVKIAEIRRNMKKQENLL